jgi:hypothetical protein
VHFRTLYAPCMEHKLATFLLDLRTYKETEKSVLEISTLCQAAGTNESRWGEYRNKCTISFQPVHEPQNFHFGWSWIK